MNALNPCPKKGKKIEKLYYKENIFLSPRSFVAKRLACGFCCNREKRQYIPIFSPIETRSVEYEGDIRNTSVC